MYEASFDIFTIFAITIVLFALVFVFGGVTTVSQGWNYTVERFGKYIRTLEPGLHIIIPIIDRIGSKMNMMERVLDIQSQEVITKDNAMVRADGVVFFQVLEAARAAYEVHGVELAIQNLSMTNLRTVIGSMDLDEVLSNRDKINVALLHVIDEATRQWGVKVTRIEIKDIAPPRDLIEAMGRQMKAEREKRAVILEAEGEKEAAIKKADGEKTATILAAEGRLVAAQRDAEARERLSIAEAEATRVVSEAIATGTPQAINYFLGIKYVEALRAIGEAKNEKIVFLPLDATGVMGAIGGIHELVKTAANSAAAAVPARVAPAGRAG